MDDRDAVRTTAVPRRHGWRSATDALMALIRPALRDRRAPFPVASAATLAAVLLAVACAMALRNPDPILVPALYGEDAPWVAPLLHGDRFRAYLFARPDYLVVGQVMLLDLAQAVNRLLFGLDLTNLPRVIAVVSYLFVGMLAAVCVAALSAFVPLSLCLALAAGIALLPLGWMGGEIIGRVLNLGYLFYPLAAALMLLRPRLRSPPGRLAADAGLAVCAMTNPLVILLLFAGLGASGLAALAERRWPVRELLFGGGLLALCLFYIPRFALTPTPDRGATNLAQLVETAGARSLLYPLVFPFYDRLNDALTLVLLAATVALVAFALRRADGGGRSVGAFLVCATLLAVVCVIALRPNLTGTLADYSHSAPDRYYQTQNVMALMTLAWALGSLRTAWRRTVLAGLAILYAFNTDLLFEVSEPRMPIAIGGTLADSAIRTLPLENPHAWRGAILLPTYPQSWTAFVPLAMARATAEAECLRDPEPACAAVLADPPGTP